MALFEPKLFEPKQNHENTEKEWEPPTFKECVEADILLAFFNTREHAEMRMVDGKECPTVLEESMLKEHSSHWEAGAKQNFDTGLYSSHSILYIRTEDYGAKPKIGKQLALGVGNGKTRTYEIKSCEEEAGVYRMTMKRVRQ